MALSASQLKKEFITLLPGALYRRQNRNCLQTVSVQKFGLPWARSNRDNFQRKIMLH